MIIGYGFRDHHINRVIARGVREQGLQFFVICTEGAQVAQTFRSHVHAGAALREDVIPATGRTKAEIAQLLGISRQHLYDILRERKPVSPAVAVRLGKLFGDGAGVWVRMQGAYDTWRAERKEDVSKIPTLRAKAA